MLRGIKAAPIPKAGVQVKSKSFDVTIPWPPLIFVSDLRPDENGQELHSANLLQQRFSAQGTTECFPKWSHSGFQGEAVLKFLDSQDGLQRAKSFQDHAADELTKGTPGAFQSCWATPEDWVRR